MDKRREFLKHLPEGMTMAITRGSKIYGTANPDSDIDMYVIYPNYVEFRKSPYDPIPMEMTVESDGNTFDVQLVNETYIVEAMYRNDLSVLELIWQPETDFDFGYDRFHEWIDPIFGDTFDAWKLRQWTSGHCNNSWAKAHKKLTVEKDFSPYIGRKSLWHVFRMFDYATQILRDGRINRYDSPELISLYKEIVQSEMTWDELKEKYQGKRNEAATLLRTFAAKPKEP